MALAVLTSSCRRPWHSSLRRGACCRAAAVAVAWPAAMSISPLPVHYQCWGVSDGAMQHARYGGGARTETYGDRLTRAFAARNAAGAAAAAASQASKLASGSAASAQAAAAAASAVVSANGTPLQRSGRSQRSVATCWRASYLSHRAEGSCDVAGIETLLHPPLLPDPSATFCRPVQWTCRGHP